MVTNGSLSNAPLLEHTQVTSGHTAWNLRFA